MLDRAVEQFQELVIIFDILVIPVIQPLLCRLNEESVVCINSERTGRGVAYQFTCDVIADGKVTGKGIHRDEIMPVEETVQLRAPTHFIPI